MRAAYVALICVLAIGAFAADLWFLDLGALEGELRETVQPAHAGVWLR